MDRQIVYIGQIPQDTDLLLTNKNSMIALGYALQAVLGTSTLVDGFACTPNSPAALNVLVGPGSIYSLQNVDATAYGSVAADTTDQIVKQGIIMSTTTLSCPAPGTAGQSINYLVQVAYQDQDAGSTVLPYYNASNPAVAWSGPNNTGVSQNTVRKGATLVQVKAGVAATTGTQTTPAADAGFTGLFSITVANGQTTVTSGNITQLTTAPFINPKLGGFLAAILAGTGMYAADTSGTPNTITIALSPAPGALTAGMKIRVKVANNNSGGGNTVINTNTLGNVQVNVPSGGALPPNTLKANGIYEFSHDGSNWQFLGYPPSMFWCGTSGGSTSAQTLTTGSGLSGLTAGMIFHYVSGFNNSGDTTFAIDSVAATHAYIDGPTGPQLWQGGETQFNDHYKLLWDGSKLILMNPFQRQRLGTALNLYVATTGNDSNQGLTSGNPFLTIQRAISYIANNLDLNGNNVTINVADGTYTGTVVVSGPWIGAGTVTLSGDITTPANCIISTTNANCITVTGAGSSLNVQGFKLTTTTGGHGLSFILGGTINVTGNMNYGSIAGSLYNHINCGEGQININNSYTISGSVSGGAHIQITPSGTVNIAGGITVTLTGTPAFANFAAVSGPSILEIASVTFSGSATGTRYIVTKNGVIDTGGGGATYLPGGTGGSTASGGQYV